MIDSFAKLKDILSYERKSYIDYGILKYIYMKLCADRQLAIWKFQKNLRIEELFFNKKKINKFYIIPYIFFKRRKTKLGRKLGLDIGENVFGRGLFMAHSGSIIVGSACVGENCILHGDNTIGSGVKIGNNCELWVGARVVGNGNLGDNVVVGSGCVVVSKFDKNNITVVGVPAREM